MFGFFKKSSGKEEKSPISVAVNKPTSEPIKSIDTTKVTGDNLLNLRKDMVLDLCKNKPSLNNTVSRVALVLDFSGSMSRLYKNGTVQEVVNKILPIAMGFDDNEELDVWIFDTKFKRLEGVTKNNYKDYISNLLKTDTPKYATNYAPAMKDVLKKYIDEEPSLDPAYVIFITDGECSDRSKSEETIINCSGKGVFWQFVGIGNDNMKFLEQLDDVEGRVIDNADFFRIKDIASISESELYSKLFTEFPEWVSIARNKKIIK